MTKYCLFILLIVSINSVAGELRPFTSDGCSSFPDGTPTQQDLWLSCCEQHDYAYWKGGTYEERLLADERLQSCVAEVAEDELALLMLAGVRVGGSPFLPTTFRWGYGWSCPRYYDALTDSEKKQVEYFMNQPEILHQ